MPRGGQRGHHVRRPLAAAQGHGLRPALEERVQEQEQLVATWGGSGYIAPETHPQHYLKRSETLHTLSKNFRKHRCHPTYSPKYHEAVSTLPKAP